MRYEEATMSEVEKLADQLERAFRGGAWHGPAVLEALAGVDAATAAARPIAAAHSIWEIVNHLTAWNDGPRRRIDGERFQDLPLERDWPPVPASALPGGGGHGDSGPAGGGGGDAGDGGDSGPTGSAGAKGGEGGRVADAGEAGAAAAWRAALAALEGAHAALHARVLDLTDAQLEDAVAGSDPTVRGMLLGVMQHNAYHAGQIVLLRKATPAGRP